MFLLFFSVWLILNGKVTAEICVFGVVISAALFYFMCRFMEYSMRKELLLFKLIPLFVRYFWVLVKEIVRANVCVLKIILSPELQPEPAFVYFETALRTGLAKVMLANSITLTPGTITVSVEGNRFCVHCLDRELAEGMEESVFVELLEEMEAEEEKMEVIEQVYDILLAAAVIVLALLIIVSMVRSVLGPGIADRIIAVNMTGTMIIMIIAILSVYLDENYLVDVCLIYAMLSFLGVVVLCKVYTGVYLQHKKMKADLDAIDDNLKHQSEGQEDRLCKKEEGDI